MIIKHGTPTPAKLVDLRKPPAWATGSSQSKEAVEEKAKVQEVSEDKEDSTDDSED